MAPIARMYEAYFTALEKQAVRLEMVASKLGDEEQRATVLDCVAALRQEVQELRGQTQLLAEWGL